MPVRPPTQPALGNSISGAWRDPVRVFMLLLAVGCAVAFWCMARGYSFYYGDAEAHLNIARRIVDTRTPGGYQIGTVWLPLPHLLWAVFAVSDSLWQSGWAAVIPSVVCFALAGSFLYVAARRVFSASAAASTVVLLFALNPNILYLQSTSMTEPIQAAAVAALLWATLWYRDSKKLMAIVAAGIASNASSLTRYEGWFLIPFVALYLLWVADRKWHAVLFGAIASVGPLAWLAHNQFYYSNALEFFNGPYSAAAIYQRQLASGMQPYPGNHDLWVAVRQYVVATREVLGWPLLVLAVAGIVVLPKRRRSTWPLCFLLLPAPFYFWSLYSSSTPIFVRSFPPFSLYNLRYAIPMLMPMAWAAGGLVEWAVWGSSQSARKPVTDSPFRGRQSSSPPECLRENVVSHQFSQRIARVLQANMTSWALGAIVTIGWLLPTAVWGASAKPVSICWEESAAGSVGRRRWSAEAARVLSRVSSAGAAYRSGSGVLFSFGDMAAVMRKAGIPFREGLYQDNEFAWDAAMAKPELFLHEEWALAVEGDAVDQAVTRAIDKGKNYRVVDAIHVLGEPLVKIYHLD
ncbi:MAG: glycosyltransferase family 39 protein [Acidobacteriota bacterium]